MNHGTTLSKRQGICFGGQLQLPLRLSLSSHPYNSELLMEDDDYSSLPLEDKLNHKVTNRLELIKEHFSDFNFSRGKPDKQPMMNWVGNSVLPIHPKTPFSVTFTKQSSSAQLRSMRSLWKMLFLACWLTWNAVMFHWEGG